MGLRTSRLAGAVAAPLPDFIAPELCALAEEPPIESDWLHEIKFDGYRLLCRLEKGRARLLTRRGNDWSDRFPSIKEALESLPARSAWLDGEAVVLDERGKPSFQALQNALGGEPSPNLVLYLFDLLYLDGYDLRRCPLITRKSALAALLPRKVDPLRYADHVEGKGPEFFAQACRAGLEGIVSKRRDAPYVSARGRGWVKVKCLKRQEFIVAGFTEPRGARSGFGALLLGVHEGGRLRYAGRVGTGFDEKTLASLFARLRALERSAPAVDGVPGGRRARGVHWTQPRLVAEVAFSEWTKDGVIRQPAFIGLRADKPASEVVPERPVALTNPDRVLYPGQGITKRALASYYEAVADWALPHIRRRPLALLRCPEGLGGQCFFQKHVGDTFPPVVRSFEITEKDATRLYSYVEDAPGLVALAQMGVLEIHPWGSTIDDLERPDVMTFDLDPAPELGWKDVVFAARDLRRRLEELGLSSFVKTTGGKGLHVVVPAEPSLSWDEFKNLSKSVAEAVARDDPRRFTAKLAKAARGGKIFVDYLRNGRGATAVAAYSTRARPGAAVSTPVAWEELTPGLDASTFTVLTVPRRLSALRRDPWAAYDKARSTNGARLKTVLRDLRRDHAAHQP